ncbi:MAG: hypothetical protein ACOYUZ_06485 [Patescibacteria group bacterium]
MALTQTRARKKLIHFGSNPYWHIANPQPGNNGCYNAARHLPYLVNGMMKAFEQGILFNWIRGEAELPTEAPAELRG